MGDERQASRVPERRVVTTRVTIVLALLVALLSVATGIINIEQEHVSGPLAQHVPELIQNAAGFTGALTGFLMLGSALALRRGLRAGWWTTAFFLPMTALQGLLQASRYSFPLVVLSLCTIPVLVLTRDRFDRRLSLSTTQLAAGGALVGVQAYGTSGAYALRDDFDGVETLLDAFYFTLITSSTVGYGDIAPGSEQAMLFTMSLVVLGVASFGIAIGALVGPAIQARLTNALGKMTDSQLELLDQHVLVLGYGDLTEPIVNELDQHDTDFAVVTTDDEARAKLLERDVPVVAGDPSDEGPLRRTHIERARAILVATNNDAQDAFAILTARELRPDVRIVSAASNPENTRKLEHAGADEVIDLSELCGHLLVQSALGQDESPVISSLLESRAE